MRSDQARVIGLALVSLALIVASVFAMDWFVAKASSPMGGVDRVGVDLRTIHACATTGVCGSVPLDRGGGTYHAWAAMAFWGAIGFGLLLGFAVGQRLLRDDANPSIAKLGYAACVFVLANAVAAGYVFNPNIGHADIGVTTLSVTRSFAPLLLVIACLAGGAAFYVNAMPRSVLEGAAPYKPLPEARVVAAPVATTPPVEHPKLSFAVATAELSAAGIDARRENGEPKLVAWPAVVGVVARRLPAELGAHAFVDVVSTAGSTLRFAPWSKVTGELRDPECRALVQLVTARCPEAHLDRATRAFLDEGADPAQLPDAATLAAHDERLA